MGLLSKEPTKTEQAITYLRECGPTCSPLQLSRALGGQPYYYSLQAKAGKLPFEFMWRGKALRVFTESVIKKLKGD